MTSDVVLPASPVAGSSRKREKLRVVPVGFRDAAAFVNLWHRHHSAPTGCKFCLGVAVGPVLVGVAIVGRPIARHYDNGTTLEVLRLASDGTPNAPSLLYSSAWKAARALGYRRLITYTHTRFLGPLCPRPCDHASCQAIRHGEHGSSLRGAGWQVIAYRPARPGWDRPSRPRAATGTEHIPRTLWELS